jgi:hypothetical protein
MEPINILLSDDKKETCDSIEKNLLIFLKKYDLTESDVDIRKTYTEHAYEHGCKCILDGFRPDVCIFDLVFNGYSGIDLYSFITNKLNGKEIRLCIYTGIERHEDKREEAELLASEAQGLITIVAKPNISEILNWFGDILEHEHHLERVVEEREEPFDLL